MNISIRKAVKEDCKRMMELIHELALYEKAPEEVTVNFDHFVESGFGKNPVWWAHVAEVDGKVVGVMATAAEGTESWIRQMAVDPALVGNKIGSTLLSFAVARLPRPIRLYTFQANVGARRFYERHGFNPMKFTDGQGNEERCPDVLYELAPTPAEA